MAGEGVKQECDPLSHAGNQGAIFKVSGVGGVGSPCRAVMKVVMKVPAVMKVEVW